MSQENRLNQIRITSFNVNGIPNPIKRAKILTKLKREKSDIVYLQETHLSQLEHNKLNRMGFKFVFSSAHTSGRRRGVAILISKKISYEHASEIKDKDGRFILIRGQIEGMPLTLFNVYAPPGCDFSFFQKIFNIMASETHGTLICGGDLNVRLNPKLDSSKLCTHLLPSIAKKINYLMQELGIIDIWRDLFPTNRDYTYYSHAHTTYSRIDYFLTFGKDRHRIVDCEIGTIDISDHAPLSLTLCLGTKPKSSLWRINSSIFNSPQIKEQIKTEIKLYMELNDNGEVNPSMLWDAGKAVLRGKIIAICSFLKKQRQQKLCNLQSQLKRIEKEHKQKMNQELLKDIKRLRNEIDNLCTNDLEKKIVRLKHRQHEVGAHSMKFLARKLRKQEADSTIYKIQDPKTKTTYYKLQEIQNVFESYYKSLYAKPEEQCDEDIDSFLNSINLPSISAEQNNRLKSKITVQEIHDAIARLKPNKSCGTDGFNSEWYQIFKDQLAPGLLSVYNWVLEKGEIPPSWREAIISVIPKEGKDKIDCANYRPISVLNVDYKLYASIIARRIESLLPDLISHDQTGFIRGRQTQDNIRRTLHIMRYIQTRKISSVILGLDAEKAFDSVNWTYLYKVLEKFGFCEDVINIIKNLYDKPSARIKINGNLTKGFTLERGCRQGCVCSPLLFALFIEPLSQLIKQSDNIKGISIAGFEHKIALFADDVLIYLSVPSLSFTNLMSLLLTFGTLSGYKINAKKTQVLTYNYDPPEKIKFHYDLDWQAESMKYLGVFLSKDLNKLSPVNFDPMNTKIKADITRWNLLPFMSLTSRVESVKMNLLPRLLYLFQTLPVEVPDKQFVEWDRLISKYLWQGKKPRRSYSTLQLSRNKGGLALPCLKDYYRAAQLRTLICWCNPNFVSRWKDIEIALTDNIPIQAMIADKSLRIHLIDKDNPWIRLPLKIWNDVVKMLNLKSAEKYLRWCAYDSEFTPNTLDSTYKIWTSKGLTAYCTFVNDGELQDFQTLKGNFGLEHKDFFRYLQVRHYFNQEIRGGHTEEIQKKGIMTVFFSVYGLQNLTHVVSKLYNGLLFHKTTSTLYIKDRWEQESSISLTQLEWESICTAPWQTTASLKWREFCWKNVIRFFITPTQKKHFTDDYECWRHCGSLNANHYHIFWDCSVIRSFWQDIHSVMERVLGMKIPFSFGTLYLGQPSRNMVLGRQKYLFKIILAASKKAITKKWSQADSPTLQEFFEIVKDIFVMEKLSFSLKLQKSRFQAYWAKWVDFSNTIEPGYFIL